MMRGGSETLYSHVNADWSKAAPIVLHLTRHHAHQDSNSTKNPKWSVAKLISQSEFILKVNHGSD